jgi:hypothetical protein
MPGNCSKRDLSTLPPIDRLDSIGKVRQERLNISTSTGLRDVRLPRLGRRGDELPDRSQVIA